VSRAVSAAPAIVRAGLLTGVVDGLFSSILSIVAYRSTASRLFQGVASVLVGSEAFSGGTAMVVLGVLMHFCVAFFWSAVFMLLVLRSRRVRGLLASPVLAHRPPTIGTRWWVQFLGHIPFVGVPIAASSRGVY